MRLTPTRTSATPTTRPIEICSPSTTTAQAIPKTGATRVTVTAETGSDPVDQVKVGDEGCARADQAKNTNCDQCSSGWTCSRWQKSLTRRHHSPARL